MVKRATDNNTTKNKTGKRFTYDRVMRIKVYSPYRSYIDEDAYSISALNATGPFDVLPGHHNFLSLLLPCELLINTPRGEQRVRIAKGIMHVRSNKVTVFLDV
jgi:F0F1-type ATP synthase epsilon subunit